jgi:hypothetical protein
MALAPVLGTPLATAWRTVGRPVVRFGGALLLGGILSWSMMGKPRPQIGVSYRLELTVESNDDPDCFYSSAWADGDVVLTHDQNDGKTVTLTNRYDFIDGCTWEAQEVLTPERDGYAYEYREHIVRCQGDLRGTACPRHGHVAVVPNL